MTPSPWLAGILVLTSSLAMASCDDGPASPTAPSSITSTTPITAELRAALERSIQDEYKAETIYQGVVNDFGQLAPFVNVIGAEQRHSSAIALMFTRRSLPVPANAWTVATVPHSPPCHRHAPPPPSPSGRTSHSMTSC